MRQKKYFVKLTQCLNHSTSKLKSKFSLVKFTELLH